MSKKKKNKNKVVKLTDEQYGAYIMALKDEKPPKLIRETQNDWLLCVRIIINNSWFDKKNQKTFVFLTQSMYNIYQRRNKRAW